MEKRKLELNENDSMKEYLDALMGNLEQPNIEQPTYEFHLDDEEKKEKDDNNKKKEND